MKENSVKYEPIHNVKCQRDCTKVTLTSEFKLLTYCIVFRHCNKCEFRWKNNSLGTLKASETWLTHILLSVGENYFLTEFSSRNYSLYYYTVVFENILGLHLVSVLQVETAYRNISWLCWQKMTLRLILCYIVISLPSV